MQPRTRSLDRVTPRVGFKNSDKYKGVQQFVDNRVEV
jgi:hypothetical protein